MEKTPSKKKLTIRKDSLRTLTDSDMTRVLGGGPFKGSAKGACNPKGQ